jgi:hypothetical protein
LRRRACHPQLKRDSLGGGASAIMQSNQVSPRYSATIMALLAALTASSIGSHFASDQDIADARVINFARRVGFDLLRPQEAEFLFYLSSDTAAASVARTLATEGFTTASRRAAQGPGWLTIATKRLMLTSDTLSILRKRFGRLFEAFGGDYSWNVIVPPDSVCRYRRVFVGPCQMVHARMFPTNGSPWVRLWKVGTRRILGVWDLDEPDAPGACPLPTQLETLVNDDSVIYGDFVVRPVSVSKHDVMQLVCIASATGIVARSAHASVGRR